MREHAGSILGLDISGHTVRRLWVEQASDIAEEYYASFTLDRSARKHLGMLSAEGGVEIETVAERDPDAIARIHIDPVDGLSEQDCRQWVSAARIPEAVAGAVADALETLYRAYVDADADLVEVNPLIVTSAGDVVLLDSKVTLDANSTFRHDDYAAYDATQTRDRREQAAHAKGLQYVGPGRLGRGDRQRRGPGHEHRRRGEPGGRPAPPTSSTSAAVPTPRSCRARWR